MPPLPDLYAPLDVAPPRVPARRRSSGRARPVTVDWAINGDFADLAATGVARYANETVRALDRLAAERHPALAGLSLRLVARRGAARLPDLSAIAVEEAPDLRPHLPQAFVQLVLPTRVRHGLVSLCNMGPLAVARQIVCMHDVLPLARPESFSPAYRTLSRLLLPRLGRRAAAIMTVSHSSRAALIRAGVAPGERIAVTYNGHEHALEALAGAAPVTAPRPFVLGIGRDLGYKNTALYFRIAPALDALGIDVAIAGRFDASRFPAAPNVRLLGRLPDPDLFAHAAAALAFLFPSRMEGFGLPAVEAMAVGCPLVAAWAPCLPETCGPAALYAEPDDADAWVAAVASLATDTVRRAHLVAAGAAQRERYSWRRVALAYAAKMRAISGLPAAATT